LRARVIRLTQILLPEGVLRVFLGVLCTTDLGIRRFSRKFLPIFFRL
jgi:hypothetical protein